MTVKIEIYCNTTQIKSIVEAMEKAEDCEQRGKTGSIRAIEEGTLLAIVCSKYLSYMVLEETDLCHLSKK